MMDFIFGGRTGIASPGELERRRELVRALKARSAGQVPQNMWEGLNSVAEAIGGRIEEGRLDAAEAAVRKAADEKFSKNSIGGVPNMPTSSDDNGFVRIARALTDGAAARPNEITRSLPSGASDPSMSERQRDVLKHYFSRRLAPAELSATPKQPRGGTK